MEKRDLLQVYQQYQSALKGLRAPLTWLDLDAFESNIDWISKQSHQKAIRIGSKSLRCRWTLEKILKSSPIFQGILSMSIPESIWLFNQGFNDLMVAYPSAQKTDFDGLAEAISKGAKITLMADRTEHLNLIQNYAEVNRTQIRVALDLDVSSDFGFLHFGVNRSALRSVRDLAQLLSHRQQWTRVQWVGLMAYEAQIAGVPDSFPSWSKSGVVRLLKAISRRQVLDKRQRAVEWLRKNSFPIEIVNGGGSGSISWTAQDSSVTEVTVGSAFYAPSLFDGYRRLQLSPAAGFALAVSRKPRNGIITCTGGGYPASGSAGPERLPQPYLPVGLKLTELEGVGEVQTPLELPAGLFEKIATGDLIFFRHPKAGELCERFNQLNLIRQGKIEGDVLTYRGEGLQWM